ncbi:MAG: phosphoribosylformylglycinamidine synthase [SAR116 cluster bacterium MED-G04]|jgi:phosphoribosylformylglycinamidine synthase PurS subunit|nr:phosphoribosylformylglycinamidine synthase [SAR116 cluster bacterium]PDH65468.1 MAG: phosphoribosylformylglycinamidine synthase [SAR116 cluster bacterium MED-G04]CAI8423694.1 MAG: Phosphoribosylformylglycinamidine synthase subunit PurS [SAR116 cluster bacterium MED-G04]HCD50777.1 phosphoribosylformylglycinamidine synthase [Alphaproteobacteria bacterium]HCV62536.1 phosphoribosylformylglycinamidine synthase [Alphaproteobacteria bacterium]|tara:strand:- start:3545 stop:3808 length:264 start_codon:yes stop_codon:yes gene_type:complete
MKVTVTITLKPGVLDPQGRAIEHSLLSLGYQDAKEVSTGKLITLDIDEDDENRARQKVAKMCETLLVNTVIEDYDIHCLVADEGDEA